VATEGEAGRQVGLQLYGRQVQQPPRRRLFKRRRKTTGRRRIDGRRAVGVRLFDEQPAVRTDGEGERHPGGMILRGGGAGQPCESSAVSIGCN